MHHEINDRFNSLVALRIKRGENICIFLNTNYRFRLALKDSRNPFSSQDSSPYHNKEVFQNFLFTLARPLKCQNCSRSFDVLGITKLIPNKLKRILI